MTTYLMVRGMEPVELAKSESYNKVRNRLNAAEQQRIDLENGAFVPDEDNKFQPYHLLTFATAEGGRFAPSVEDVLALGSDTENDKAED